MKKLNNVAIGEGHTTVHERDVDEANAGKKSEFSNKKPLPSIGIEKDPEFSDSVLCAATMHIRHRPREPGPVTTQMKDVPRPGPGRRSPLIPTGPSQGPCGDLPPAPRKSTEGTHKRDVQNPYECQHRQSLLNPPWRATCAVVEPTQAGSICFERLPRGLKQLKPVDLCYRHGHRRRLNSIPESQPTEGTQRRGRAVVQQRIHGLKQRGDFNSNKANIGKTDFKMFVVEEANLQDISCRTLLDDGRVVFKDSLDTSLRSDFSSAPLASTQRQPGNIACVTCTDAPDTVDTMPTFDEAALQQCSEECEHDFPQDQSETPHQVSEVDRSQNITVQTDTNEMISMETGVFRAELGDMELCHVIPSKPHLLVKAESMISCRTVNGLHTDERPKSFTALSLKERGPSNFQENSPNDQPGLRENIEDKDQQDECVDHQLPVCFIAATNHQDIDSDCKHKEHTCFYVSETDTISEPSARDFFAHVHYDNSCPSGEEQKRTGFTPTTIDLPGTNLTKAEIGESQNKRASKLEPSSCESLVGATSDEEVSKTVPLEIGEQSGIPMYPEDQFEESQNRIQTSSSQSDGPKSLSSLKTKEEVLHDIFRTEQLSFSVDSSRIIETEIMRSDKIVNPPTRATDDHGITQTDKMQTDNFERPDGQKLDLKDTQTEHDNERDVPSQNDGYKPAMFVHKSQSEDDPCTNLPPSLCYPDIAIGVKFFKTPEKSPVSNCDSENRLIDRDGVLHGHYTTVGESFTIRKITFHEDAGKSKYLVLPDQDKVFSDIDAETVKTTRKNRQEVFPTSTIQDDKRPNDERTLKISNKFQKDSNNFTVRKESDSICSEMITDCTVPQQDTMKKSPVVVHVKKVYEEKNMKQGQGKTDDEQQVILSPKDKVRTGTGRRARTKAVGDIFPIDEDEQKDALAESVGKDDDTEDEKDVQSVSQDGKSQMGEEKQGGGTEDGNDEEWFPPFVSPLPRSAAASASSGPSQAPEEQAHPRRINLDATGESNRFFRIHGNNLNGDGPWGQGDRIERPGNYVEPSVSLGDMCSKFFTDTTPLDMAFNSINVINSCSNSISYHSCDNQKRLLAALDGLKQDDVYKHALICLLARQCAAATEDFSQSLHKVFRRFSNRARASQEALIEYCRALAAGEMTSPEMLRQIKSDGRRLYMVWKGGQYVTRYANDAAQECSSSSSGASVGPSTVEKTGRHASTDQQE